MLGTLNNKWLSLFTDASIPASFGLLGFIYILGIAVSRLADDLLDRWNKKWQKEIFGKHASPSYHKRLNFIIAKSENATDYLSYRRSIIRITRACSINFFIGTLGWILVLFFKPVNLPYGSEILISALSAIIAFLLIRALPVVMKGYFSTIRDVYKYLPSERSHRNEEPKF